MKSPQFLESNSVEYCKSVWNNFQIKNFILPLKGVKMLKIREDRKSDLDSNAIVRNAIRIHIKEINIVHR